MWWVVLSGVKSSDLTSDAVAVFFQKGGPRYNDKERRGSWSYAVHVQSGLSRQCYGGSPGFQGACLSSDAGEGLCQRSALEYGDKERRGDWCFDGQPLEVWLWVWGELSGFR